ncbi:YcxB family protein [Hoeflea sp.]|uniref:YcxB family protein n=1 Tax=Hoeflea sp. TaxID=1940281 RepID=UPI0037479F29
MPAVKFFYETRDFLNAYALAARVARFDRKRWLFLALAGIAGIGLVAILAGPHNRGSAVATAAILIPLAAVAAQWLVQRLSTAINGRIALKTQPVMREEFTFEIQPEHFIQRSKHGETIVGWSEMKAFTEDKTTWLLYPDFLPHRFYVLPKRKLTPEFAEALGDRLQAARIPRR